MREGVGKRERERERESEGEREREDGGSGVGSERDGWRCSEIEGERVNSRITKKLQRSKFEINKIKSSHEITKGKETELRKNSQLKKPWTQMTGGSCLLTT